jgi:hypothetical protein
MVLARDLASSFADSRVLVRRFDAIEVDASGADLSALDLTDMTVLEGVTWTDETTWPPGMLERVRTRSREIRPGVYQVRGGSERDPSRMVTAGW